MSTVEATEFQIITVANQRPLLAGAVSGPTRGSHIEEANQLYLHQCANQQNQLLNATTLGPAQA